MARYLSLLLLVAATAGVAAPITTLKRLYPQTPLCVEGKACAVMVAPPSLREAAAQLSQRLQARCGADFETLPPEKIVSESWQVDLKTVRGRTLIALGSINDNRLLAVLWGGGYVVADSLYPGPGGYAVRTVHDPFASGTNVLALTGSDAAGVSRAVDVFGDRYLAAGHGDVVLTGPVIAAELRMVPQRFFPAPADSLSSKRQPQYSGLDYFRGLLQASGLMDSQGRVVAAPSGDLTTVTGAIARLAQTWFLTGNPELPPLMKQLVDSNRGLLKIVPPRVEMEGSSAQHVRWWDLVEELPVWTDQDRLDVTNALLADALQGWEQRAANTMVKEGYVQVVDENHGTNAALNALQAWGYFHKYYPSAESDYWLQVVRATFAGQAASFQVLEDACGYLCYCPFGTMQYAFGTGDLTYLTRGIARSQAEYIAQCSVSNLGLASGFGDDGSLVEPAVYEVLTPAAWYYRDPHLAWVAREFLPQAAGLRTFTHALPVDLSLAPEEPRDWEGLRVFPLYRQSLRKGEGAKQPVFDPAESAGPEWFNKAVFRDRFSPAAQYLLLDGAGKFGEPAGYPRGPAGHMHADVNTIVTFTDQERLWLVDHTYADRSIKDHSGLYIARNGQVSYQVHEARLRLAAQSEHLAATTSVFEGFSGANWERTILWQRGRRFVVIDRAVAREPGDYRVRCSFRALGEAKLDGAALRLTQGGKACTIIADGGGTTDLQEYQLPSAQEFLTYYKHAAPTVRLLRQDKHARLEAGEALCFVNLLQAAPAPAALQQVSLRPLAATSALVTDGEGVAVCGTGELPGGGGDADAYVVGEREALLGNLRRLGSAQSPSLATSKPISLSWCAGGALVAEAAVDTQLTVVGAPGPLALPAGRRELPREVEAVVAAAVRRLLAAAPALAEAYAAQAAQQAPAAAFGLRTRGVRLGAAVTAGALADLDGDGAEEILSGGPAGVRASRADGGLLWQFATSAPCTTVTAADLGGDARPEVLAGCDDGTVYLLGAEGGKRWQFGCQPTKAPAPAVDWLQVADLEGDGTREILVGAAWLHCLDPSGKVRWEHYLCRMRGALAGDFARGAVADVNADGKQEIVALFDYSYPKAVVYGPAGTVLVPPEVTNESPGVNIDSPAALLVAGLFGQTDRLNWLVGSPSYLYTYWAAGPVAGQAGGRRAGAYTHLASWGPAGRPPLVFAATDLGTVVALRPGAARAEASVELGDAWSQETDATVTALWAGDSNGDGEGEVWVATKGGAVLVYAAQSGEALGRAVGGDAVAALLPRPGGVLALHRDGAAADLALAR